MRRGGIELVTGVEVSLARQQFSAPARRRTHQAAQRARPGVLPPPRSGPPAPAQAGRAAPRPRRRNRALVDVLQDQGFAGITIDYLTEITGNEDSIGRPHFARAMFELHPEIVGEPNDETWRRIFVEWLGGGGAAYVPKTSMAIEEFVDAAAGSGTVFSIAHPLVNYLEDEINQRRSSRRCPGLWGRFASGVPRVSRRTTAARARATRALMVKLTRDAGMIPDRGIRLPRHLQGRRAAGRGPHRRPAGARRSPRGVEGGPLAAAPAPLRARRGDA